MNHAGTVTKPARVINGPHVRTERTTRWVMLHVAISLVPALLGAVYFFGIRALYLTALSVAVCVLTEYLWQKITKKQITAGDFSAVVTGMLLAFNMPATAPGWVVVLTSVFSILVVKQMFGGIGNNFANPALMGRLLAMVVWPGAVMQYIAPVTLNADAVSSATVLGAVKTEERPDTAICRCSWVRYPERWERPANFFFWWALRICAIWESSMRKQQSRIL